LDIKQCLKKANTLWENIKAKEKLDYSPIWEIDDGNQLIITEKDNLTDLSAKLYFVQIQKNNWKLNKIEYFEIQNRKPFVFVRDIINTGEKVLNVNRTIYLKYGDTFRINADAIIDDIHSIKIERNIIGSNLEETYFQSGIFNELWKSNLLSKVDNLIKSKLISTTIIYPLTIMPYAP